MNYKTIIKVKTCIPLPINIQRLKWIQMLYWISAELVWTLMSVLTFEIYFLHDLLRFFSTIHYGVVKNTFKSFSGLKLWTGYIRFSATTADKDLGLPSTSMQWISSTKKQWTSYLEGFVGETENISAGEHQELTDI